MILGKEFSEWYWLVVTILASWRLTNFLCYERGPFGILISLRKVFYKLGAGELFECFHCACFWVSLLLVLTVFKIGIEIILIVPAVAGGASLLEKATGIKITDENDYNQN
jgi:hypothetical protein